MANYFEYTTQHGDTFDIMALDAYNDEFQAHLIIQENPDYANILIFEDGITIKIPIIEEQPVSSLPPWKR